MKTKFYIVAICATIFCVNTNAQWANTSLSNLVATKINVALLPGADNSYNLGNSTRAWRNLYIDTAVYINGNKFLSSGAGTGSNNVAVGVGNLNANTTGFTNVGVGYNTLSHNQSGYLNVAVGDLSLYYNTSGTQNIAFGTQALEYNNSGSNNIAIGSGSLFSNTTAHDNVSIGKGTLENNVTANNIIAVGDSALFSNSNGAFNTALGSKALYSNVHSSYNTANGFQALYKSVGLNTLDFYTGNNTAFGAYAGYNVTDGSGNTFIGEYANCGSGGHLTNATALGQGATVTSSNHIVIGNSSVTSIGGFANWSNLSDGRVKKNIKQNVPGLSFINKLKPITYNLDLDAADKIVNVDRKAVDGKTMQPPQEDLNARKAKEQIIYTGFIAQDVEKAAKDLNYDFSGVDKPDNANTLYGLRYSDFVVPLVKAVQELSKQNDALKSQNQDLEQRVAKLEAMMNVSQSTVNSQQSTGSSSAMLLQNNPNPFSSSTNITYSLPQHFSSAKIIITDKNGNALKTISLSNAKGSVNIDAVTLSSGAYQYSLYVDAKLIDTKQMILTK